MLNPWIAITFQAARLGFEADMGDGFSSGFRIATGDSSSPVSANQSLGTTNGEFSKYALWLDRAFVNYRVSGRYLIVDRLFAVAELRLGTKKQQIVRITRLGAERRS